MSYRYEESISFSAFTKLCYAVLLVFLPWSVFYLGSAPAWGAAFLGLLLLIIPFLFGRLRFLVDDEHLVAEYGYSGWLVQRVPIASIARARVVTYRPLLDFGGWGIRYGKLEGERTGVYSMSGNGGLLLELTEDIRICRRRTKRFLLGTREPEGLAAAIGRGT